MRLLWKDFLIVISKLCLEVKSMKRTQFIHCIILFFLITITVFSTSHAYTSKANDNSLKLAENEVIDIARSAVISNYTDAGQQIDIYVAEGKRLDKLLTNSILTFNTVNNRSKNLYIFIFSFGAINTKPDFSAVFVSYR